MILGNFFRGRDEKTRIWGRNSVKVEGKDFSFLRKSAFRNYGKVNDSFEKDRNLDFERSN